MPDKPFTFIDRTSFDGRKVRVRLVRAGDDVIGHISTNGDGYVFGQVLVDPDADDGVAGNGHVAIGYSLPPCNEKAMAEAIATEWAKHPGATALRGMGVGGWPLVKLSGRVLPTCPSCGGFSISINIRPGVYGTGPGGSWRMGDPGGHEFAYCHGCGAASDAPR